MEVFQFEAEHCGLVQLLDAPAIMVEAGENLDRASASVEKGSCEGELGSAN